jgi:hypothetical protein
MEANESNAKGKRKWLTLNILEGRRHNRVIY